MEDLEEVFGNWGNSAGSGETGAAVDAPSVGFARVMRPQAQQQQRVEDTYRRPIRPARRPPARQEYRPEYEEQPQYEEVEGTEEAETSVPLREPRTHAEARLHQARYFE